MDNLEMLALKVSMVLRVNQVDQDQRVQMDCKVLLVRLDQKAPREKKDPKEMLDLMDYVVMQERPGKRDTRVLMETEDRRDRMASWASKDPRARRVIRGPREKRSASLIPSYNFQFNKHFFFVFSRVALE